MSEQLSKNLTNSREIFSPGFEGSVADGDGVVFQVSDSEVFFRSHVEVVKVISAKISVNEVEAGSGSEDLEGFDHEGGDFLQFGSAVIENAVGTQGFTVGLGESVDDGDFGSCVRAVIVVQAVFKENVIDILRFGNFRNIVQLLAFFGRVLGFIFVGPEILQKRRRLGKIGFVFKVEFGNDTFIGLGV